MFCTNIIDSVGVIDNSVARKLKNYRRYVGGMQT